ncbi:hypothetical protein ACJJIL_13365 [Microbulbifer sp. EKSA005]|uniref:hypothetical protein n=1 Tax=Microbulbifer sp. EKSA005 TaxID=3243364 RepID=UPI0040436BAE
MKKLIFFLLFSSCANGTSIEPATLEQLLESTDHVLHVLVQKVDMITSSGEITFNPDGRTSPLSGNKIRLHVKLMPNGVIKSNLDHVPPEFYVELWEMWHYQLGNIQGSSLGEEFVFLLRGPDLNKVYPRYFMRKTDEKPNIIELLKKLSD